MIVRTEPVIYKLRAQAKARREAHALGDREEGYYQGVEDVITWLFNELEPEPDPASWGAELELETVKRPGIDPVIVVDPYTALAQRVIDHWVTTDYKGDRAALAEEIGDLARYERRIANVIHEFDLLSWPEDDVIGIAAQVELYL